MGLKYNWQVKLLNYYNKGNVCDILAVLSAPVKQQPPVFHKNLIQRNSHLSTDDLID